MKKTLRAVGAAGLAAATIVTGLGFGPAAHASMSDDVSGPDRIVGPFITQNYPTGQSSAFHVPAEVGANTVISSTTYAQLADAQAKAKQWSFPGLDTAGPIMPLDNPGNLCLTDKSGLLKLTDCLEEEVTQQFLWGTVDNQYSKGLGLQPVSKPGQFVGYAGANAMGLQDRPTADSIPNAATFKSIFTAEALDIDIDAGTATLSGNAPTDVTDVDIVWATADGGQRKRNEDVEDGKFTHQLTDLALGTTTVHLTAYNDGVIIAETDVEVKLEVAEVTAKAEFSSNALETVQLSGTAQPKAPIEFRHGGKTIGGTTTMDSGDWTGTINAPNMPGPYNIEVVQKVRGEDAGTEALDIDYGSGVTVTSPADGVDVDPADPELVIRGAAPQGTKVKVYEKGHAATQLGEPATAGANGTYRLKTVPLEDREYTLVVEGITKGYNRTRAELTVNPGKSSVANPTASVEFPDDVTKQAVVKGTGVVGATITVKNDSTTLGTKTVGDNGEWSLPIDPIGAGKHTLTIEQSGIEDTQTVTTDIDYGAAVSLTAPSTFSGGKMTVTGTSSKGAQVAITTGGEQVDSFTVTNEDGSFSRNLTGLGSGKIELQATAKSKGALTTDTKATSTAPITAESVQISSHVKDGTFMPGEQLFTGRGTVGATITFNVHGFASANAAFNQTTTVDQFGEWSISRRLADTTYPLLSVKQTPQNGVVNELTNWNLRPYKEIGQPGDLQLTNFKDGDFFNPGDQTFTGKATPGAKIVFNPFGLDNPDVESYDIETTADVKTGEWTIRRSLANVPYDRMGVRQEPAAEGKVNQINLIGIAPYGWVGTPADLTVTSHADGTFIPGMQTFTGTATPGTKVTLYAWGDNPTNPFTTHADVRGKWSIDRNLGAPPTTYNVKIVQENAGTKTSTVYLPLTIKQ